MSMVVKKTTNIELKTKMRAIFFGEKSVAAEYAKQGGRYDHYLIEVSAPKTFAEKYARNYEQSYLEGLDELNIKSLLK